MYISTRGNFRKVPASEAIKLGMVPAGGLFVPARIPLLPAEEIFAMRGAPYREIAGKVISLFLDDFTEEEIKGCVARAYRDDNFDHPQVAPLYRLDEQTSFLELWHGPTAAFKDLALQIMPHFLSLAVEKTGVQREIVILVATSGDTGKAALEGFRDVPGTRIIVFYPYRGVSKIQELQMTTTDGSNTGAIAVRGNFDDCQEAVKDIFADKNFSKTLARNGYELSSANSINWGRLLPQIVYYFWAYLNLLAKGEIAPGEKINFTVPTGNFGNILAAWYAREMGLPVHKLICASNENRVLTDFFRSGIYDRNREFKQTRSPSMDILISSNLERFLFGITGGDAEKINAWMADLKRMGRFQVDPATKKIMDDIMACDYASEEETLFAIKEIYRMAGYISDTHTAVGYQVYRKYLRRTGDSAGTVIDATASPYKFSGSVLEAIKGSGFIRGKGEFEILEELAKLNPVPLHFGLRDLDKKPVLHRAVCERRDIRGQIKETLGI